MKIFDEMDYIQSQQNYIVNNFIKKIELYDQQIASEMLSLGYKKLNNAERTVVFSFGVVTFSRSRWYKNNNCVIPVDKYLQLEKYSRFSKEFLYRIAQLSTYMSYRKVVETVSFLYHINITKDVVLKANKLSGELLDEYQEYRFFEEKNDKKEVDILYIEGDGVFLKSTEKDCDNHSVELSHFVVHEGRKESKIKRNVILNKKEFVSTDIQQAKEELIDYIYNHYSIKEDTLLITNADGGLGYSARIFKEIAKTLCFKRHEHFLDSFHINENVRKVYRTFTIELRDKVFSAIRKGDKELLKMALDTTESLIEKDTDIEEFKKFSARLLNQFKYIVSAKFRGLKNVCIGIMESQHRKITYRMKKRGMYWSIKGVERMSKMIIRVSEGTFRELFFGNWRQDYVRYKQMENSAYDFLKEIKIKSAIKTGKINNAEVSRLIQSKYI